ALCASAAFAQTIKIGFITSYSGLNGNLGPYMERAVRLYVRLHEKELPPGVKIELLTRDDTGPNPDKARQLAQELVVRDKVDLLAGVIFTPNAMAIAPIATEAKVPFVIMNAGTSVITTRSPYIVRTSIKLIGPGDITTDEELPNMGDIAIGVLTVHHYSAAAERPANKAFVAAWKKEYGANEVPNFLSAGSWDGTDMIFAAIKAQKGKLD